VEFKSACISTTLALESISYWVAAQPEDKVGVVIASDIARYPLRSSGEYTQGAGSVSLLVKKNPRLVALEQIYGSFTRDENDFFRPMGNRTAVVNGKHSNLCYLDAMEGAFDAFARKALRRGIIGPGDGRISRPIAEKSLIPVTLKIGKKARHRMQSSQGDLSSPVSS